VVAQSADPPFHYARTPCCPPPGRYDAPRPRRLERRARSAEAALKRTAAQLVARGRAAKSRRRKAEGAAAEW